MDIGIAAISGTSGAGPTAGASAAVGFLAGAAIAAGLLRLFLLGEVNVRLAVVLSRFLGLGFLRLFRLLGLLRILRFLVGVRLPVRQSGLLMVDVRRYALDKAAIWDVAIHYDEGVDCLYELEVRFVAGFALLLNDARQLRSLLFGSLLNCRQVGRLFLLQIVDKVLYTGLGELADIHRAEILNQVSQCAGLLVLWLIDDTAAAVLLEYGHRFGTDLGLLLVWMSRNASHESVELCARIVALTIQARHLGR